jgi:8-oxo-dGTP pyrophosphatase MutT (NUDIX family)
MVAEPRKASTVIVIREPMDILLMQRSTHDSFIAKATVYPGGAVDETDNDEALMSFCNGFNGNKAKAMLKDEGIDEKTASGFFFAAIRELFEESSILLAKTAFGKPLDLSVEPYLSRFKEYRRAIHDGKMTLAEMAQKEGLIYTPEDLIPFAHWITPAVLKTRFDTWFFLTRLPFGQEAVHDNKELTSAEWMSPQKAIGLNTEQKILLMPPTLMTLREIATFGTINKLFVYAATKDIPRIQPEVFAEETTTGVRLPYDPGYLDSALKQPPRPGEPSRAILENGFWKLS